MAFDARVARVISADYGAVLRALDLRPTGDDAYVGDNVDGDGDGRVTYGGLFLAQAVVAAARTVPGRPLRSLHTLFARSGTLGAPFNVAVRPLHRGGTFASATVTSSQAGRLCTQSLVLLEESHPLLRGGRPRMPVVAPPEESASLPLSFAGSTTLVTTAADSAASDGDEVGALLWSRFPEPCDDPALRAALLAYIAEPFFMGAALPPLTPTVRTAAQAGLPAVVSNSVTAHADFVPEEWHLFVLRVPRWSLLAIGEGAGRARLIGTAEVFARDGGHIASITQDCMLRPVPLDR